ncbi:MAG: Crp/Fnr family transcriptional regulator [Campylobacterota bacterium]
MQAIDDALAQVDVFSLLEESDIYKIIEIAQIVHYQKSDILFYESDLPTKFFILLDGDIKLYKVNEKEGEVVLHRFDTPTMIAEMAVIEELPFPATAEVMAKSRFAVIDRRAFLDLILHSPSMSLAIIRSLNKKIKTLEQTINNNLVYNSLKRVASFILSHPQKFQSVKKVEIAQELNMAPETLSRMITKLKKQQIVGTDHALLDRDKLLQLLQS